MPNPVPAAATGLPAAAPFTGLPLDHLHEICEETAFALDISVRRPDTRDELEARRYLCIPAGYPSFHPPPYQEARGMMLMQTHIHIRATTLHEVHDSLVQALAASERPRYSQPEREARKHMRCALRGISTLLVGAQSFPAQVQTRPATLHVDPVAAGPVQVVRFRTDSKPEGRA